VLHLSTYIHVCIPASHMLTIDSFTYVQLPQERNILVRIPPRHGDVGKNVCACTLQATKAWLKTKRFHTAVKKLEKLGRFVYKQKKIFALKHLGLQSFLTEVCKLLVQTPASKLVKKRSLMGPSILSACCSNGPLDKPVDGQNQGCQIFLDTTYQNGGKYTTTLPNGHKIYQMTVKYFKWLLNIPALSILRPSEIYPNWYFWFENVPSGNPGQNHSWILVLGQVATLNIGWSKFFHLSSRPKQFRCRLIAVKWNKTFFLLIFSSW
jgi:hypothetical protein